MKQSVIYCCEFCDRDFYDQSDCEEHEAAHFGLTRREYLDWRILNKEAASAGRTCGLYNDEITRKEFDDAVMRLCKFEKQHELTDVDKKPSDFYT